MSSATLPSFIEFHNTPAPEPSPAGAGWILPRYPRPTYNTLESPGFLTAQESTGVELRFVTAARHLRVFVSALDRATELTVFKGDFHHSGHTLAPGVVHCIHLTPPDLFDRVQPDALRRSFHPGVWRIVFDRGTMVFHGIDAFGADIRRPRPEEKPALRWLAYGSSITHSSRNGYPHRAAAHLGVDVQNKGLSGSCYLEASAAEFLATGCDWDFATLELGVNVRATLSPEEFELRARRLVDACVAAKPGRPVVLITIFRNAAHRLSTPDNITARQDAFDDILRQIAREYQDRQVGLIEGSDVVDHLDCLVSDLLHPNDFGHARMGENLAKLLRPVVATLPAPGHS